MFGSNRIRHDVPRLGSWRGRPSVDLSRKRATSAVAAAASILMLGAGVNVAHASADAGAEPTTSGVHGGDSAQDLAGDFWSAQPRSQSSRAEVIDPTTNPWPVPATVVERMRAYGLNPILEQGWDDPVWEFNANLAGVGTKMEAVMIHDTGTSIPASRLQQKHSLNWIMTGNRSSQGRTVRACHFYVDRIGEVHVVFLGRTWHAGAGDAMFGTVPANKMNAYSMGIEIESQGDGVQDLTPEQIVAATKVAAAALDVAGLPSTRAINHKDYAGRVQGKVDTAYDNSWWRGLIDAERGHVATTLSAPVISPDPSHVSVGWMKSGATGPYVERYQNALRVYAKKVHRVPVGRINPTGPSGTYDYPTKRMTKMVLARLKKKSRTWATIWNTGSRVFPNAKLIKKMGLVPLR